MDQRTYYMILGVSRTESPGGIRSAYRDLAKKLHPDVAGEQATHAFQEVTEAYDVLSDPRRRRAYNDELRRAEASDLRPIPVRPQAPAVHVPASIVDEVESRAGHSRIEDLEGLNIEVLLTPEEGRRGGALPVRLPVSRTCHQCGGSGRDWLFPCLVCGQRGTIQQEEVVPVRIPPRVRSGSIFGVCLRSPGMSNFYLRLHVFVEPQVTNERR